MKFDFQDQDSALFRHEVAFVLGQVGPAAAGAEGALAKVVEDDNEHPMVRHEAVEALGAIDTEGAIQVLKKYLDSPYRIVRERLFLKLFVITKRTHFFSCEVALDQEEYYNDSSQFQPIAV